MNRAFELIVFDWDGTLMDSEAHIVASMLHAGRFGIVTRLGR